MVTYYIHIYNTSYRYIGYLSEALYETQTLYRRDWWILDGIALAAQKCNAFFSVPYVLYRLACIVERLLHLRYLYSIGRSKQREREREECVNELYDFLSDVARTGMPRDVGSRRVHNEGVTTGEL